MHDIGGVYSLTEFDNEFGFECFYCKDSIGGGLLNFDDSLDEKMIAGWTYTFDKNENDWIDVCKKCSDDKEKRLQNN